ncbi:MAG: transketolase [Oscillospiraceae bacterium]|jgi:transketolase
MSTTLQYQLAANRIRRLILKAMREQKGGHIGGSMSIADAIAVLYTDKLKYDPKNPKWEGRDWVVMSKGHAGPALYAALALKGFFPEDELLTMNKPGTRLPSHCDRLKTPGVDMSTGSLGQGASTAIGVALGHKLRKMSNKVFLILGDGECNEGQVWEGALFAAQHGLDNLIVLIDYNRQQLDGYTKDICDLGDLAGKFSEFGFYVQDIDGHDADALSSAIDNAKAHTGSPSAIILNTIKGKGCIVSEGVFSNHHMSVAQEKIDEAAAVLDAEYEALKAGGSR